MEHKGNTGLSQRMETENSPQDQLFRRPKLRQAGLTKLKQTTGKRIGRPLGTLTMATREIRTLAQEHGPWALKRLVYLASRAQSEQVQVTALQAILDRAYGKSPNAPDDQSAAGRPVTIQIITGVRRAGDDAIEVAVSQPEGAGEYSALGTDDT